MDKAEPDDKEALGYSENAVYIHVWVAVCTYIVVRTSNIHSKNELSIYEIVQILGISSMDKISLQELLTEYKSNQNVNEQTSLFSD